MNTFNRFKSGGGNSEGLGVESGEKRVEDVGSRRHGGRQDEPDERVSGDFCYGGGVRVTGGQKNRGGSPRDPTPVVSDERDGGEPVVRDGLEERREVEIGPRGWTWRTIGESQPSSGSRRVSETDHRPPPTPPQRTLSRRRSGEALFVHRRFGLPKDDSHSPRWKED